MPKIAIVTDSNSGITQSKGKELGIFVLPMPFMIDEKQYFEDIDLTQESFYEMLLEGRSVMTSQPSPDSLIELWNSILKEYDEVVHIPMSSGLSGACQTAMMIASDFGGRVQVVNNQRISVTQKQSVFDAMQLASLGKSASEIKDILEEDKMNSSIYIMVDTLDYLKKGGRITPAAAAIGSLLHIKPVLQIQGEKLDAFAKARTVGQGKNIMISAAKKDMEQRFGGISPDNCFIHMAYTYDLESANAFKKEVEEVFPGFDIVMDPLSLSVSCHIGPGALAITVTKKLSIY